jgi:hypothetical protein
MQCRCTCWLLAIGVGGVQCRQNQAVAAAASGLITHLFSCSTRWAIGSAWMHAHQHAAANAASHLS